MCEEYDFAMSMILVGNEAWLIPIADTKVNRSQIYALMFLASDERQGQVFVLVRGWLVVHLKSWEESRSRVRYFYHNKINVF